MRRLRRIKILATLGPASSDGAMIPSSTAEETAVRILVPGVCGG